MAIPAVGENQKTAGNLTYIIWRGLALLFLAFVFCGFIFRAAPRPLRAVTVVQAFPIPFETDYIDVPEQYKGFTEILRPGVQGERRVLARVLYEGDRPARVVSIKTEETGKPVRQVARRGTKVLHTPHVDGRWSVSFISPLNTGWLSADFYDYPHHNGIDLAAPFGTPVYASAGGKVVLAGWYGEYGRCVILEHPDRTRTLYAHNSRLNVYPGQRVRQGEQIAQVGSTGNSTGNHLHFEIRTPEGFLDPLLYLEREA